MGIRLHEPDVHVHSIRTRMPFRYGIAVMTGVPHVFVRGVVEFGGQRQAGIAADGLPPKWFRKDPEQSFADEIEEMCGVIRQAMSTAVDIGEQETPFVWWRELYARQQDWAAETGLPPLLAHLGTSLLERAMLDGFCRITEDSFSSNLRWNTLGIDLGSIHEELAGADVLDLLPLRPVESVFLRQTVGLGDYLTDSAIPDGEHIADGLPQSLEGAIRHYGLQHFKIKLSGNALTDVERLLDLMGLLDQNCRGDYAFSLDGNEQFGSVREFRSFWDEVSTMPQLGTFLGRLLFVEQPLKREHSFTEDLAAWGNRPPIIIDEADAELGSAAHALACGYAGTSHKNCKGIFKGIANACLLAHRREQQPDRNWILSGEDLGTTPPISILQDLCVMANLGIETVERNGHHYYRGASMWPEDIQRQLVERHGALFDWHDDGFATLRALAGKLDLGAMVNDTSKPFGVGFALDPERFTPLDDWEFASLEAND